MTTPSSPDRPAAPAGPDEQAGGKHQPRVDSETGEVIPTGPMDDSDAPEAVARRRAEQRSDRRVDIRSGAVLTPGWLFMNSMAAVIAAYGLLADSPAVVIGAMIVAMLLGPIMAMALAISDGDLRLARKSGLALLVGGVTVYGIGLLVGIVHLNAPLTAEITNRTAPTIFDLAIALAGGAAGAYAAANKRVGAGVVGVAIATALVPPLVASALLTTRAEWSSAAGAFLLAALNILAIQFAAAIVLWLNGLARDEDGYVGLRDFLRRHAVSLLVLGALAIVLGANLRSHLKEEAYGRSVRTILSEAMADMPGNRIVALDVVPDPDAADGRGRVVLVDVDGPRQPSVAEVAGFSRLIPPRADGVPVRLRVRYSPTVIVTPQGLSDEIVAPPLSGPPAPPPSP